MTYEEQVEKTKELRSIVDPVMSSAELKVFLAKVATKMADIGMKSTKTSYNVGDNSAHFEFSLKLLDMAVQEVPDASST